MSGTTTGVVVTGTTVDMVARMRAVLPAAWFPLTAPGSAVSAAPVLDGLLTGVGAAWAYCFTLLGFVDAQTRLASISESFLDLLAFDFFGNGIRRRSGEGDPEFRARVTASLLVPRATRQSTMASLESLTGLVPALFEPRRGGDTGGYGCAPLGYGSALMPFQYLISLSAAGSGIQRESQATYVDQYGQLQLAPRHVQRPLYVGGVASSLLIEARSYNLLKDSVAWSRLSPAAPGSAASWIIDVSGASAFWSNQPTVQLTIGEAGSVIGPSVSTYLGSGPACASIWLLVPSGHTLSALELVFSDGLSTQSVVADLTIMDRWQRLVVSLSGSTSYGRTATLGLVGSATASMTRPLITQCWQIEPGSVATSYIPSFDQIGMRDADLVIGPITLGDDAVAFTAQDVQETIGRVVPAGSIAWLNLQPAI